MTPFLLAILLSAAGFDSYAFLLIKLVRCFAAILLDFPHDLLFFFIFFKCLAFLGSQLAVYYKGNWLHTQPSVNISLLPMAKRIYNPRAISEHITVTCRPCKIKGHTYECENQSPHTTAIAPFKPSKTSTSHARNRVHLLPCCSCWSAVLWGIQHTRCQHTQAGRQLFLLALHTKSPVVCSHHSCQHKQHVRALS